MDRHKAIITIEQAVPRLPELRFQTPVSWQIQAGEQWAVIGPNGSGKTILADMLQQRYALKDGKITLDIDGEAHKQIKSIAFKDIHSLADSRNSYYQQRWHATETNESPTVAGLLTDTSSDLFEKLQAIFSIKEHLTKRVIHLSSGELRKFLIIRTLLSDPKILILDNPFIGLDADSRTLLTGMLAQATRLEKLQLILLLSNPADIPPVVTHVLPVLGRYCFTPQPATAFLADRSLQEKLFSLQAIQEKLPVSNLPSNHQITFRAENVTIRYGSRTILKNINWEVQNGEKWALCGPNGSGKSLLLSLLFADNPQAYTQTLYLFDRRRGTGESIWDIKKRIGYVSPEMHLYYMENVPTIDVVCSGFFDSIGLFRKCNVEQHATAIRWMEIFGIGQLKNRLFLTLSSGEQRLSLLARAFVKDPDLIILDEPLHGLDISNKQRVSAIIETFCARKSKTLIYVTHYPNELPPCVTKRFELT